MIWITLSEQDSHTLRDAMIETSGSDPRATVVVAMALVEDQLTRLLTQHLVRTVTDRAAYLVEEMLKPGGALSDFNPKVDFMRFLSYLSEEACSELHSLWPIRNEFAYNENSSTAGERALADRCGRLKLWNQIDIKLYEYDRATDGRVALAMGSAGDGAVHPRPVSDLLPDENVVTARDRFVATCRFYIAAFLMMLNDRDKLPRPMV